MAVQIATGVAKAAKAITRGAKIASTVKTVSSKSSDDDTSIIKIILIILLVMLLAPTTLYGAASASVSASGKLPTWMSAQFVTAAYSAKEKYGIPVSAGLGQMILEAGVDISNNKIAAGHNYGGVKYAKQSGACGYTKTKDGNKYAAFESDAAWLNYYYNVLLQQNNFTTQRGYKVGCKQNDPYQFWVGLGEGGYCEGDTGETYANKVKAAAESFPTLQAFDSLTLSQALSSIIGSNVGGTLTSDARTTIVNAAISQLGVPYVWGGETPNVALDCSGLTMYCYKCAGINIPHYTGDQLKASKTQVDVKDAQAGDILYKEGHVAIYIGNGKCIEAPHSGAVVRISSDINRFTKALRF